jgi:general secretion pathway protein C
MKRLPLLVSFIAVVALSASLAYWTLQWFAPPQRPIAAVPASAAPEANVEAAAGLFGGQQVSVAPSNYRLKGVVAAANGRRSAAIIEVDGKPARALAVGGEVVPGVTVKQIEPRYVLLSEGGVVKRVELALESAKADGAPAQPMPAPVTAPAPPTAVPSL